MTTAGPTLHHDDGGTDKAYSRRRRVWAAALALASAAALLAGCTARSQAAGASTTPSGRSVSTFAIATPEKESDHGWNAQGLAGARAAAKDVGATLHEHSDIGYDNPETVLRQIADAGAQFIVAHASGFATAAIRVADTTDVPVLIQDKDDAQPGRVAGVIPRAEQGGYLAGVVAAHATKAKRVAIVLSADNTNWNLMSGGFAQGVRSVDPAIRIDIAQIGPAEYADSVGGRNIAAQAIAAGADVIFGMGDGATIGYLQAIETAKTDHPVHYIATIGDVSTALTDPSIMLTSVLWDYEATYVQAIEDIEAGTYGTHNYTLDVAGGGMRLLETNQLNPKLRDAANAARDAIASGAITVTRATTMSEVQALVSGG